jgi:hypothetical protein
MEVLKKMIGTGVRINLISPGQIDIGIDLKQVADLKPAFAPVLTDIL